MNKYGISESAVIPVRKEQSEKSEIITQILFGETFQIIEETIKWSYIKLTSDNYMGWIDNKVTKSISEETFSKIQSGNILITQRLISTIQNPKQEKMIIPAGSALPNFNPALNIFSIDNNEYKYLDDIIESHDIVLIAGQFLNCPYLWGGKSPFGIDCSGFVQVVYNIMGRQIPRDSFEQVKIGEPVGFISDTLPGDLAFFDDSEGNITHVGLIISENEIIHSSGKVRIDKIDQQGIYNSETKKYTHKLRVIKRIQNKF